MLYILARSLLFPLIMKRGKEAKKAANGFTLIELLTVLAVAAVLTSLSAAALGSLRVTSEANAEARRIYAALRAARWKAVRPHCL